MKPLILKLVRGYSRDKLRIYSSSASFYVVVSALPLIAILIFTLSHFSPSLIKDMMDLLEGILPLELFKELNVIISSLSQRSASAYVPFSIIAALWGSTKGISGLCYGIESIYHIKQHDGFILRSLKIIYLIIYII